MTLIACTCPHCGGVVNMDDSLTSGFCTYCGRRIINENAVIGEVKVTMDHSSEIINTLKLVKYSMYEGDVATASTLLGKAMLINSENSDVWYMDAVIDRKNRSTDIDRARRFPSYGIFTEDDVEVYKNFDCQSRNSIYFIMALMGGFMAIFAVLPVAIIFEYYLLIPMVLIIDVIMVVAIVLFIRKKKPHIPTPVFNDERSEIEKAALNETENYRSKQ